MIYRTLADSILVIHFLFIIFVVFGGFFLFRSRRFAWLHIPVVIWGAFIEFSGRICPLTPLENYFRIKGNQSGYTGGFIEHYLIPVIYPSMLTRNIQFVLGALVLIINLVVYLFVFCRRKSKTTLTPDP